jgi:hypothetical protein
MKLVDGHRQLKELFLLQPHHRRACVAVYEDAKRAMTRLSQGLGPDVLDTHELGLFVNHIDRPILEDASYPSMPGWRWR